MGFLAESEKQSRAEAVLPRCGACKLSKGCMSPRMPVTGGGRRSVLVVAEAPGAEEDEHGVQLVGKAGKLLRRHLKELGWNLDRDCWKTNAVCCRPPKNRGPTEVEVESCRPLVMDAVRELKPRTILLLGATAVKSVVGAVWREVGAIGKWVGWRMPLNGVWVCPTWHPSYLLRDERNEALKLLFRQHLESALELDGDAPPPPVVDPELIHSPREAAAAVSEFVNVDKPMAFDFETDRLKPDHPDARIVCCAISDGGRTIAYPWAGPAVDATREFLHSTTPKIGWNIKFEQRWTRRVFGKGVRNWMWDGIQATHVLDNRSGITSLKFQAFVRLGFLPYAGAVDKYFLGQGNVKNQIHKADLDDLLRYNGTDAALTAIIGLDQMKELGHGY